MYLAQIKKPLQKNLLETAENIAASGFLWLCMKYIVWYNKIQSLGTSTLDNWINFEVSVSEAQKTL